MNECKRGKHSQLNVETNKTVPHLILGVAWYSLESIAPQTRHNM